MLTAILLSVVAVSITLEIANYFYYLHLRRFVKQKRYFHKEYDPEIMSHYFLNEASPLELKEWILNSMSYCWPNEEKTYYNTPLLEHISRNCMLKWAVYYLYFQSLWQISDQQLEYANEIVDMIETKINIRFPDIDQEDIYFLKFGANHINAKYKPLVIYGILYSMKTSCYAILRYNGFRKYRTESGIVYFHYRSNQHKNTTLFLHGLGFGITPYLKYIMTLKNHTNLIIPIVPNISNMDMTSWFQNITDDKLQPSYNTWRQDMRKVVERHGINHLNVISHSFGTIVLGILLQDPWFVQKFEYKVFVEPVCFVEDSYKTFRYINESFDEHNKMLSFWTNILIYSDIYIRYVAQRYLFGPEFWITDNDILEDTLIVLSENDALVPSHALQRRMEKNSVQCMVVNNANHSDIFLYPEYAHALLAITAHVV